MSGLYLDHHAATPLVAEADEAMREASDRAWANPSSVHRAGQASRSLLEAARTQIAGAIGAEAPDLVLTSGGTEACNLAVLGGPRPTKVITTAVEHPAIAEAVKALSVPTEVLSLDQRIPSAEDLASHLIPGALVALQWVNHETGDIFRVSEYAQACREHGASLVIDATQALGRLPVDVNAVGADALAFASHKVGGPSGAGALWVRRQHELHPRLLGGAQERGRRAGSPHVLATVGFGAACAVLGRRLEAMDSVRAWRDRLEATMLEHGAERNGWGPRVDSVSNTSMRHWRGDVLVAALDVEGVQVSAGAACSSGLAAPSPVLASMYSNEPWRASSALRISLGPEGLDDSDIERADLALRRVLARQPLAKPS